MMRRPPWSSKNRKEGLAASGRYGAKDWALDFLWIQAPGSSVVFLDDALVHQCGQLHLEGLHALALTHRDGVAELAGLTFPDQVANCICPDQDLIGSHQAASNPRDEALVDDAGQAGGQLHAHLPLAFRREHGHEAVDGLG